MDCLAFLMILYDGWGRLLLDRALLSKSKSITNITPLNRLAYVGTTGIGALTYKPEFLSDESFDKQLDLDEIAIEMTHILEGSPSDIIDELFRLGGSSGGAKPKAFVGYNPKTNHLIHGKPILPPGYEHWILKFPSHTHAVDIAQIEYAYHQMALDSGIEMSE